MLAFFLLGRRGSSSHGEARFRHAMSAYPRVRIWSVHDAFSSNASIGFVTNQVNRTRAFHLYLHIDGFRLLFGVSSSSCTEQ